MIIQSPCNARTRAVEEVVFVSSFALRPSPSSAALRSLLNLSLPPSVVAAAPCSLTAPAHTTAATQTVGRQFSRKKTDE